MKTALVVAPRSPQAKPPLTIASSLRNLHAHAQGHPLLKIKQGLYNSMGHNLVLTDSSNMQNATKNPIYHFYTQVDRVADRTAGDTGDLHYQCYHRNKKIITLKKTMKFNLTSVRKIPDLLIWLI